MVILRCSRVILRSSSLALMSSKVILRSFWAKLKVEQHVFVMNWVGNVRDPEILIPIDAASGCGQTN